MNKKKILFIITKSNFGGAQRYVFELATNLPRDTYEVVVAFGGAGLLKTRLEEHGIRTYTIRSFERDINLRKELHAMKELREIIMKERPDIVHLNSSKAGGSGALIARLCGVPLIIFTAHGWPFYEPRSILWKSAAWFFSYLTTLLAHKTIVVSRHNKENARMPGLSRRITYISTSLPRIEFESRDTAREALLPETVVRAHQNDTWLVSTGELNRNKNIGVLISALGILKERGQTNLFLTVANDGELRTHIEDLVTIHNVSGQVYITGSVPEMRVFLKAFDIFLMPSLKEGLPYGLLEAGAAGLAVIASNVGGIPEVIEHGVSGILTNPNDDTKIADAIAALTQDTTEKNRLGSRLKETIETRYTFEEMLTKTMEVYEAKGSETV
jgi:glycosyltransferase involved in cell wall biosynthesis